VEVVVALATDLAVAVVVLAMVVVVVTVMAVVVEGDTTKEIREAAELLVDIIKVYNSADIVNYIFTSHTCFVTLNYSIESDSFGLPLKSEKGY
jgi:hypothetical protein